MVEKQTESNSDVKSARRVLEIFQLFAEMRGAASLATISKRLEMPKSSCLALLKTLEANGYLYCFNESLDYYPTRRMWNDMQIIIDNDPLLSRIRPFLQELCQITGETVFLAKRNGQLSHYIEVVQSGHALRYAASVGEKRQIHIGAAGQCLVAAMNEKERSAFIDKLPLDAFSPNTVTDAATYKSLISQGLERGWFLSLGGYQTEVASVGNYIFINGEAYAVVVAGPTQRIRDSASDIGEKVVEFCLRIAAAN